MLRRACSTTAGPGRHADRRRRARSIPRDLGGRGIFQAARPGRAQTGRPDLPRDPKSDGRRVSIQFVSRERVKVEFLTPNRGSDNHEGKPVQMPALGGAATLPLWFLDSLIHQPTRAVLLHGAGVPVLVSTPERYADHTLTVGSCTLSGSI